MREGKGMTGEEYRTFRTACGLSQAEAAIFHGLKNWNTVRRWERGKTPVSSIAEEKIRDLNDFIEDEVSEIIAGLEGCPQTVALLVYDNADLDMLLWDHTDIPRQAHAAIIRRAFMELIEQGVDVRLVRMNRAKYMEWLGDRADTQDRRATWAASQIR